MSDTATADAAATTDWRTYDGVVPQKFIFYVVFFPLLMAACIALPTALCYLCLSRGRPTPYSQPNEPGFGTPTPTTTTTRKSGFPSSPMMWPSVSLPSPSPLSPKSASVSAARVNSPGAGIGAAAAASESTLVARSPSDPQKQYIVSQESFGSPVPPGFRVSLKPREDAGFDESPILKSFSPYLFLLLNPNVAADRCLTVTQIGRVLTMDQSIMDL